MSSSSSSSISLSSLILGFILAGTITQQLADAFVTSSSSTSRTIASSSNENKIVLQSVPIAYDDFADYDKNDDDDEDDDEEDDFLIDPDSLGDWRDFRRNLASSMDNDSSSSSSSSASTTTAERPSPTIIATTSKDNEEILKSQSEELAEEYRQGAWAHSTTMPEVGGLLVRMPLEVELSRNYRHSIVGNKLRKKIDVKNDEIHMWYNKAQKFIEEEMQSIAGEADEDGQIDATLLSEESTEMLQIYLDNQETWQEVCLVIEKDAQQQQDMSNKQSTALVLNRPMATKLTDTIAKLVLFGVYSTNHNNKKKSSSSSTASRKFYNIEPTTKNKKKQVDLIKFMLAFGNECAVYCGGPDDQEQPGIMIHGFGDIEGAIEISPGIYRGGDMSTVIDGVLDGTYQPLDFRFFIGRHSYKNEDSMMMDVSVHLGKYQPVACARSIPLKQCLSLPKPLWNEVLELCGGELAEISALEMLKRDELKFHVVDDDEDDSDDILDELNELGNFDEDEDDFFYN